MRSCKFKGTAGGDSGTALLGLAKCSVIEKTLNPSRDQPDHEYSDIQSIHLTMILRFLPVQNLPTRLQKNLIS